MIEQANKLGKFQFAAGTHTLVLSSEGAKGNVHADAFQLILAD